MGTKQENADRRDAKIVKMEEQVKAWTTQLDEYVVGYLKAGSQTHDAYHVRIDDLRTRLGVVQTKLNEFTSPAGEGGAMGTFQASIKEDWDVIEAGIKELVR